MNRTYPTGRASMMLMAMLILTACSSDLSEISSRDDVPITTLFDGFVYLGYLTSDSADETLDGTGPYPTKIQQGRVYIFSRRLRNRTEDVAIETLPTRLRSLGFDILRAPKTDGSGLALLEDGVVAFVIEAEYEACELEISQMSADHAYDPWRWPWEDPEWETGTYDLRTSGDCEVLVGVHPKNETVKIETLFSEWKVHDSGRHVLGTEPISESGTALEDSSSEAGRQVPESRGLFAKAAETPRFLRPIAPLKSCS